LKIIPIILLLLLCSSCQKKKSEQPSVQRVDNYVPPASEAEIDTTQGYVSPSDAFSDHSNFDISNFQTSKVSFRGTRNISYQISQPKNNNLTIVVEYLNGAWKNGDTASTATRILLYLENELLYRKAFPLEFADAVNFLSIKQCDNTLLTVSLTKSIVYYWFDKVHSDGSIEKEYHAISVDKEGVTNELSGDLVRVGSSYESVRFLNENRLKAKVSPNSRYPNLTVDLIFSIDWKICTAVLDVPIDTVFAVSDQPSRYFNSKIKLYQSVDRASAFRETAFRRLTQAQMQRIFLPSLFDRGSIDRDRLYIEFNRTIKGWIDYETLIFEEIISEN